MPVLIPFGCSPEHAKPLQDAIAKAAADAGITEEQAFVAMTHFWEAVAAQVCRGNAVRIPGFGMFAASVFQSKMTHESRAFPAFCAARSFKAQVANEVPPRLELKEQFYQYVRAHHRSHNPSRNGRVYTAMRKVRQTAKRAARLKGLHMPPER